MPAILVRSLVLLMCLGAIFAHAAPPTGFAYQPIGAGWNEPVGTTFTEDGQMFVWERTGRVWRVSGTNKSSTPFLDIAPEVGAWRGFGLLGFALHPNFKNNGYVYLLYVVDRHYLVNCNEQPSGGASNCGAGYSATTDDYFSATIGRVTRYTAIKPSSDLDFLNATSVDYNSRKVLVGETPMTGCPLLSESHGTGSLAFGDDETLFASCGEGASLGSYDIGSASDTYWDQALNGTPQIIRQAENVGSYRAQLPTSLSGKIIRIDPMTGDGIPSNPLYNSAAPRSPASRLWALGLRNPFRFSHVEGTGSHDPSQGNPGTLLIGDVGSDTWESFHVSRTGGENFGWPYFEGMDPQIPLTAFVTPRTYDRDAPNPLFGVAGCAEQFFAFQDLIKQESMNPVSFPNPCNASQSIPASIPTWVHHRPEIDWNHWAANARWSTFDSSGNAVSYQIGQNGVSGSPFQGNSATGGVWYTGTDFPASYRNTYFIGDYGTGWILNFVLNGNFKPQSVRIFDATSGPVVHLATNPIDGGLYFVVWGVGVYRATYSTGNLAPSAAISANTTYGKSPLTIQFSGAASKDPEGLPLTYLWNFGDGTPTSAVPNPSHTFIAANGLPTPFTVSLQVTDQGGLANTATIPVSLNNTPPAVHILTPLNGTRYPLNAPTIYSVSAAVSDAEQSQAQIACSIQVTLHHEKHTHPDAPINACQANAHITPLGCGAESFYYQIGFRATDSAGLSGYDESLLFPDCQNATLVANAGPDQNATDSDGDGSQTVVLDGSASTDTTGSIVSYIWFKDGVQVATGVTAAVSFEVGSHVIRLEIDDVAGNQAADTAYVTVLPPSVPDIVALAATLNNDGIVDIPGATGTGVFGVATVNVGANGTLTASADTGSTSLPVNIFLCQTNPVTGACLAGPASSVTTQIAANDTPTFGVFAAGTAAVPFDPANNRIFVRFKDGGGVTRGATSVAVRTVPDIVALAATLNNDGIVNIPGATGTGVFAVATVNVGANGVITASADTGSTSLPVNIFLCQTNPVTGACLASPASSVTIQIAANDTPTFGVFAAGTAAVPFDPANNRIFVRFKDGGGVTRGATSVAVRTQ